MAKIPVFTRRILPSGRTAGVPIPDVDIVGVGEARGLAILGRAISGLGETLFELGVRERMADDSLAVNAAGESRDLAKLQMKQFMLANPDPSTWLEGARGVIDEQRTVFAEQKFSPRVLENEKIEQEAFESELLTGIQILTTERKIDIDIQVSGENLINKIATDDGSQLAQRDINKQTNLYRAALERRDPPEIAAIQMRETLRQAEKLRMQNAINGVHAEMEAENFGIARELAKNPIIPETKQTTLRTAINTAETVRTNVVKEEKKALIDKTTSDTIREYFSGELTVATLNERHAKDLIKDSEFKFMMTGLTETAPEHSDTFAAGRIRRAFTDFDMGVINRAEADEIILENYAKLDNEAREKVVPDLEDVEARIIATAKSNAYSDGISLMSRRFVGIQSEEDLIDLFRGAGLTEDEKKRINRRWTAEVNNRNLYEQAVKDRFKEMRKEGISDVDKYTRESLKILLQYQRRTRLDLVSLEERIREEQREIIGEPQEFVGPPAPLKLIDEMTTEEKQRQLERIRELRKLTK